MLIVNPLARSKEVDKRIGDKLNSSAARLYEVEIFKFLKILIFLNSVSVESFGLTLASNVF